MPTASVDLKKPEPVLNTAPSGRTGRAVAWSSFVFALLQSVCAFLAAANGVRFAVGVGSLALGAGVVKVVDGFHADWIRLPMMGFALAGSVLNLVVLWQVRRLRARPAASWRVKPVSRSKLRMEWGQVGLSVATLALVVAEEYWHLRWHHHV